MTFLELAKLLHEERTRFWGATPFPRPLSRSLAELVEAYDHRMYMEYPNVKAAIRQFSRNRELRVDSTAEKHAIMCRFDYAIAVLLLLESCYTENGARVVSQPNPAIAEEDLIEWALIKPLEDEIRFLNMNAMGQATLDDSKPLEEGEGGV